MFPQIYFVIHRIVHNNNLQTLLYYFAGNSKKLCNLFDLDLEKKCNSTSNQDYLFRKALHNLISTPYANVDLSRRTSNMKLILIYLHRNLTIFLEAQTVAYSRKSSRFNHTELIWQAFMSNYIYCISTLKIWRERTWASVAIVEWRVRNR